MKPSTHDLIAYRDLAARLAPQVQQPPGCDNQREIAHEILLEPLGFSCMR